MQEPAIRKKVKRDPRSKSHPPLRNLLYVQSKHDGWELTSAGLKLLGVGGMKPAHNKTVVAGVAEHIGKSLVDQPNPQVSHHSRVIAGAVMYMAALRQGRSLKGDVPAQIIDDKGRLSRQAASFLYTNWVDFKRSLRRLPP